MPLDDLTGKLLAMLVHDFRTPLSSVIVHLELLDGARGLSPDEREDLAFAVASARELSEKVAISLDTVRLATGALSPDPAAHDFAGLVREACQGRDRITVDAKTKVTVRCDRALTLRAVAELVREALAFTPSGNVGVRVASSGGHVRLEISDRSTPIPDAMREKMFDEAGAVEIRMAKRELSRGIGPVFCRRVLRAQGGDAGVSPGESGNVWWIELPG